MSDRLFCIECGTQATPGGKYCMSCGTPLQWELLGPASTPQPSPQPVPQPSAERPPERPSTGSPWKAIAALLGLLLGGFLGAELGQTCCYGGALASSKTSPGATPQVVALAESQNGTRPGRILGGIAGFLVTVLCLGKTGGIRWFSFAIGGLTGGVAGAVAGFLTGYF